MSNVPTPSWTSSRPISETACENLRGVSRPLSAYPTSVSTSTGALTFTGGSVSISNVLPANSIISVPSTLISDIKLGGFGAPKNKIKFMKMTLNDQKVGSIATKIQIVGNGVQSSDYGRSLRIKYLDDHIRPQFEALINRFSVMENIPAFPVPIDQGTNEGWIKLGPQFNFPSNAIFDATVSFGFYGNTETGKSGLFLKLN